MILDRIFTKFIHMKIFMFTYHNRKSSLFQIMHLFRSHITHRLCTIIIHFTIKIIVISHLTCTTTTSTSTNRHLHFIQVISHCYFEQPSDPYFAIITLMFSHHSDEEILIVNQLSLPKNSHSTLCRSLHARRNECLHNARSDADTELQSKCLLSEVASSLILDV